MVWGQRSRLSLRINAGTVLLLAAKELPITSMDRQLRNLAYLGRAASAREDTQSGHGIQHRVRGRCGLMAIIAVRDVALLLQMAYPPILLSLAMGLADVRAANRNRKTHQDSGS